MSRTILITGAQGFIGRYLVQHWLEASPADVIVGLGRSSANAGRFTHTVTVGEESVPAPLTPPLAAAARDGRYQYRAVHLQDREGLEEVLRRHAPAIVVHLAGALRDEPADHLFRSNVIGTENLLEAIAGIVPAARVVLGSSGIIGAIAPGLNLPLADDAVGAPIDLYTVSKTATEQVARITAARRGLHLAIARIFNVVGPGQDERHVCGWLGYQCAARAAGGTRPLRIGPRHTTRDFVDVRDVARALWLIAENGVAGTRYNVGSGRETSIDEIFEYMTRSLPKPLVLDELPPRPGDVERHVADISRIAALGYRPAWELERSLDEIQDYYRTLVPAVTPAERPRPVSDVLHVAVQESHKYAVTVRTGLVDDLPATLRREFPDRRVIVITDVNVMKLYGESLVQRLQDCGVSAGGLAVTGGESSKSFDTYREVMQRLYELGFDRRAVLLNLGGGVVIDLGGFVASSYMRGVSYVNVPTTLLAQHDAAIGGKTAINSDWAKNFVGAFHHPLAVYCDPGTLATLPAREVAAGIAESIKVAIIGEPALFRLLESVAGTLLEERPAAVLEEIVLRSARTKVQLLARDPLETDLRRPLNLGHTFGHPLETMLAYRGMLHGEAVAMGIVVATLAAETAGICPPEVANRILRLLRAYGLPPRVPIQDMRAACRHVHAIRLVRGNQLHYVLPVAIGEVRIVPDLPDRDIAAAIDRIVDHPLLAECLLKE